MERVIVTGGAGYIGSHVCKALASRNIEPVTVDDLRNGHADAVLWGPLEQASVLDGEGLAAIIRRYQPSAVLHLAGLIMAGESVQRPMDYYADNVGGTIAVLQAMKATAMSLLVFSSTASIYGIPTSIPVAEGAALAPINPYGSSKTMCERILADCAGHGGPRAVSLRYFNACGADEDGHIGERHRPETHLIPLVIRAALDPDYVLTVHGSDYDTPDGTGIRDYVHVSDIAAAHVLALDYLRAGGPAQALNLGTGSGYSVRQVIAEVERQTGRTVKLQMAPRRPGDTPVLVADASLAMSVLGWTPHRSDLATIVASACAWHARIRWAE